MKYVASAVALAVTATAAAADLDRSGQRTDILFADGNYAELSFGNVNPSVSGAYAIGGQVSGDVGVTYNQISGAIKHELNEDVSVALIFDQPFGADVEYGTVAAGVAASLADTSASFKSQALTALLKYNATDNVSVYGGLKAQWVEMEAAIPLGGLWNYEATADRTMAMGYVIGAAYEIPEIALRAALTYHSQTEYDFDTVESSVPLGANRASTTNVVMPEAINLDFQTGIMADTLLMVGFRWVNWAQTDINPADYTTLSGRSLQKYDAERVNWSLGVGRRFNEKWSGSVAFGWQPGIQNVTGNLGPTDGYHSLSLGAAYQGDGYKVSAGVRYIEIGDTTARGTPFTGAGNFSGNSAVAMGLKIGFDF